MGFENQFRVMGWSTYAHTHTWIHTHGRCWKVICESESHVTLSTCEMELFPCAIISSNAVTPAAGAAQWWSHRLCRSQTDDLNDDLQLRPNYLQSHHEWLPFFCFFFFKMRTGLVTTTTKTTATESQMRVYICVFVCVWIWLLQSTVNLIRKEKKKKKT